MPAAPASTFRPVRLVSTASADMLEYFGGDFAHLQEVRAGNPESQLSSLLFHPYARRMRQVLNRLFPVLSWALGPERDQQLFRKYANTPKFSEELDALPEIGFHQMESQAE
jgi:hypothetical protein